MFKQKRIGHVIVREDNTKNILSILNRNDLFLFILRNYYPIDKEGILKTPIKEFNIARKFECIYVMKHSDLLISLFKKLKSKQVNIISYQQFLYWMK